MRRFLLLVLGLFLGFVTYAQDAKPNIKFDVEEIDYGTIQAGANGVRVFEFRNTGKAPLVIEGVISTCGCITSNYTKEPIQVGAKGKIEVKYDTNKIGSIRKTITVTTNSAETPTVYLRIKGEVVK